MPVITLDSEEVRHIVGRDARMRALMLELGPLEHGGGGDAFERVMHSIIEQMMSVKAAATIDARFHELCGGEVTIGAVRALTAGEIRSVGVSARKAESMLAFANDTSEAELAALAGMTDAEVMAYLTSFPGIGAWTAKMTLVFTLGRPDVLPYEDGAFMQAYRWLYHARSSRPVTIGRRCEALRRLERQRRRHAVHPGIGGFDDGDPGAAGRARYAGRRPAGFRERGGGAARDAGWARRR